MKRMMYLLILVIFIASMGMACAQDLNATYVDSNVDVSGNGSITNPYKTIAEAVNSDASTIYVSNGIYSTENDSQIIINRNITIIGLDEFTINGDYRNNIFYINSGTSLTLNNIRLINTGHLNVQTYGAIINYGNLTVNNGYFENSSAQLAGVILNYGNLFVENSTFKSNNAINYGGAITNFGKSTISNSNFTLNTAREGEAILNSYDMEIINSNFLRNSVKSTEYQNIESLISIYSSYFYDSELYVNGSGARIRQSYVSLINTTDSVIDIAYSFINTYDFADSDLRIDSNLWCSDENIPDEANDWLVMLLADENGNSAIPINKDSDVLVSFRIFNGNSYVNLPTNVNLPNYYVSFEADNGEFNITGDYIKNNQIKAKIINNTKNTKVYAKLDEYYAELVIGTGYNNQEIYVSKSGSDKNGNGSLTNPYKTISKAVKESLNGDIINIFAGEYHWMENSNITVTKSLTFKNYGGNVTIYRADACLFNIERKAEATIIGLNFRVENYNKYFPIVNNAGSASVINCTFDTINGGESRKYVGGALMYIYYSNESVILTSGDLKVDGCNFTNIEYVIIRSLFEMDMNYYKYFDVEISNSIFKNCYALEWESTYDKYNPVDGIFPGFMINVGADNVVIDRCQFIDNDASVLRINDLNSFKIKNSLFKNNKGSIYNLGNFTEVVNTTITEDQGPKLRFITGHTISISRGVNSFKDSTFYKNNGVIINTWYVYTDEISLYNCSFINNTNSHSQGYGNYSSRGIIQNGGIMSADYCTFINNSVFYGGVFYNENPTYTVPDIRLSITNSVFYHNKAILGNDIFMSGGSLYTSDCWWGTNQGPTDDNIFINTGEVNIKNWAILSFDLENSELIAGFTKVTDANQSVYDITGILPSRVAIFDSDMVEINPKVVQLTDNVAKTRIDFAGFDITANVTVDDQTIDLMFYNKNTMFNLYDRSFYGIGNDYSFKLKSVNGYELTYQDVLFQIWNNTDLVVNESLKTNSKGEANYKVNLSMGNYTVKVFYLGNDYFRPVNATASLEILPFYTVVNIKENQTFYGNKNLLYAYLYNNFGNAVSNQTLIFTITDSNSKVFRTYAVTDIKGQAAFYLNISEGSYEVNVSYEGDGWHYPSYSTGLFTITPVGTNLAIEQSSFNGRGNLLTVILRDDNYRAIFNETVKLSFSTNGVTQYFNITTNEDGRGGVIVNLAPGSYSLVASFKGDDLNHPSTAASNLLIKKVNTILSGDSLFVFDNNTNTFSVGLCDVYKRQLVGENVLVEIISQSTNVRQLFDVVTDNNGVASLKVNLDLGNYLVRTRFEENAWYYGSNYASTIMVKDYMDGFDPHATILNADDLVKYQLNNASFMLSLSDIYGKALFNQIISVAVANKTFDVLTDAYGQARLGIDLEPGVYAVSARFENSTIYSPSYVNATVTVLSQLIACDLVKIYKNGSQFIVGYVDDNGNPLSGKSVYFTLNNQTYERLTNESGQARLNINLGEGAYDIITRCENFTQTNRITVISPLSTSDLRMYYKDGSRFKARLYDDSGRALSNATVSFTINEITYTRTTDSFGEASLAINLNVGAYTIITKYGDIEKINSIYVYNMAIDIASPNQIADDNATFTVKVTDVNGNPIVKGQVTFKINGQSYIREINQTGYAKLNIKLNNGLYRIVTAFCIENYQDVLYYNTLKVTL
ncbi:MAG: adhesin [Methanobrevibacter millerae]|uniref:Adhesin n=1 Tax=Methanobrevibacter millerae TaxID=230361 RepID=A0A8T3VGM7_9EURY|nr:adhesin [Methanobrevibacter millerae]